MPYKPRKPCRYPNCSNLTDEYYCEQHKQLQNKNYNNYKRNQEVESYYRSRRWKKLSRLQLSREPICCMCKKRKARIADHIIPIKQGGSVYDVNNLQSLCIGCHNKKHHLKI